MILVDLQSEKSGAPQTIDDPAQGRPDQTLHRNPLSLLAGILTNRDSITAKSATAIAADSTAAAESVQTLGERFTEVAQLAATARTAAWLDQLVDAGHLTSNRRAQLAAEDGAASLGRLLRRVEL